MLLLKHERLLLGTLYCLFGLCPELLAQAQQAPPAYFVIRAGYNVPAGPDTAWPSGVFSLGSPASGLSVNSLFNAASGSLTMRLAHNGPDIWRSVGFIDIYVRGGSGTQFAIQWDCVGHLSASSPAGSGGTFGVFFQGCTDSSVSAAAGTSDSKTVNYGESLTGTSTSTIANPAYPGVVYSLARTVGHWIQVGANTCCGQIVGQANADLSLNFSVAIAGEGQDSDGDGVPDSLDRCPATPPGTAVDVDGCSAAQRDSDGDGVPDTLDQCPGTPPGTSVDANGCPRTQLTLTTLSGNNQTGNVGSPLPNPLVVKTTKPDGTPASGVSISLAITQQPQGATGAALTSTNVVTASDGTASTQLTLGDNPGPYQVTASCLSCAPSTVIFTETAVAVPEFSITSVSVPIGYPAVTTFTLPSPVSVQTVFNPRASSAISEVFDTSGSADLVFGKATAFFVGVRVNNRDLVPAGGVEVQVRFGNNTPLSTFVQTQCISPTDLNCFRQDGTGITLINTGFLADQFGSVNIVATVNPETTHHIPAANASPPTSSVTVNVKSTKALRIGYVPINGCSRSANPFSCYGPLQTFNRTVQLSTAFIQRTYPVADLPCSAGAVASCFSGNVIGPGLLGSPSSTGVLLDAITATRLVARADPTADHVIAVVPCLPGMPFCGATEGNGYFAYHGLPRTLVGLTWVGPGRYAASLVSDGTEKTAAHELGHRFGEQNSGLEEYRSNPPGNVAAGFWVGGNQLFDNAICFMGGTTSFRSGSQVATWVDNFHYNDLFSKLVTIPTDPEVLLVTGILHRDGRLDLQPWDHLPSGVAEDSSPGDYRITALDGKGNAIAEVSFPVSFNIILEPVGIESTNSVPLIKAVPYPRAAISVRITKSGQLITQVNVPSKLLFDAVSSIPSAGFDRNPSQRRNALLEKITEFDVQLARGTLNIARQKLRNDIRKHLNEWLIDGYPTESLLQYTKPQVLSLVDDLLNRLGG